jgi:hypothetical protein
MGEYILKTRIQNFELLIAKKVYRVWIMVFNATFTNISVVSWWTVSLVGETGVPRQNTPQLKIQF